MIWYEASTEHVLAHGAGTGAGAHQTPDQDSHRARRRRHCVHLGHGGQGAPGGIGRRQGTHPFVRADDGTSRTCRHEPLHDDEHEHEHEHNHADDDLQPRIECPRVGDDGADEPARDHDDEPARDHDDEPPHDHDDPAGGDVRWDVSVAGAGVGWAANCAWRSARQ